jgi:dihydroorotase (multifunctional complex type)
MKFDLGIEGGEVVRGGGRQRLNVYVTNGRIAALSAQALHAQRTRDATGLLVMPGMVDTHVHLMDPADTSREDFPTGTLAAANAGVTTIIEHTHGAPVREPGELADKLEYLRGRSRVDYALAAHAWPDRIDQVGPLWRAGVAFFKVFTCTTHGVPGFDAGALRALFGQVNEQRAICLVHCEDESITARLESELRSAGRADNAVIPEWRHPDAELVALGVVGRLSGLTGARVVTAHASSPAAVEVVADAARGAPIVAESCPQYLTLLADEVLTEGALRKFTPPARAGDAAELDAMWQAAADGRIHHIATDHAPSTREQKQAGSIWDVHFGLPGLDTTLPVLLDGAAAGRLSYERVVELYAEAPARAYGLAPRKGHLEGGADADIVLVDPAARWTISAADIRSKAGWSPFEGLSVQGRAVATYLRGELIAEGGSVVEPGVGQFVAGPGARS